MTCGFGCGSFFVSRPRPAGDEWDLWSLPLDLSLLSSEILPAAFTISFFASRCPRAAGSESLKCFLFHSPTLGNFWKIFFKMSVCSRSVFMKICWKVATLGVLNSLSPAVFFLWLYYITALVFRLFADPTILLCNICAYSGLNNTCCLWYNKYVGRVYAGIDNR